MRVAILGLGKFGKTLATTLFDNGVEVIAIDRKEEPVNEIKNGVTEALVFNALDEKTLRAKVSDVDFGVVAMGDNIETSIMATALLKRIGVGKIIARAINPIHAEILSEIGAHRVVQLEEMMAVQIARSILTPNIQDYVTLSLGHSVIEMRPPERFIGKTLRSLHLRAKYGVNVIAIKKRTPYVKEDGSRAYQEEMNDLPGPSDTIGEHDRIIVIGSDQELQRLTSEEE